MAPTESKHPFVAGVLCSLVLAGCGADNESPGATGITCQDWDTKTKARETMRAEFVPRFQEVIDREFPNGPPVGIFAEGEDLNTWVDDAVRRACEGQADDFRPYEQVVKNELTP